MLTRRSLLISAGASLIAAPAIVRASSLMPIQPLLCHLEGGYYPGRYAHYYDGWADGTSFIETVDFETRTSEIRWTLGSMQERPPYFRGAGCFVPLEHAEMRRRQVENWATRREFHV